MSESDHDLLISHSVEIKSVCKKIDALNEKLGDFITSFDTKCERRHDRVSDDINECVKTSTFQWVSGFIITSLILLFAIVGTSVVSVNVLGKCVELNGQIIKGHEAAINKIEGIIKK